MKKMLSLAAAGMLLAASTSTAQTLLYLNFESQTNATGIANGTVYTPGGTELVNTAASSAFASAVLGITFYNNGGDGPSIGALPGGLGGITPSGTKALLTDSGGFEEGLRILSDIGLPTTSFTMEAVWFTADANPAGNTVGIQSVFGGEASSGQENPSFFLRTVGPGLANRMDWWSDQASAQFFIADPNHYAVNTLYHDVLVFEYNSATPTNSQMRGYRNGTLVNTGTYDATAAVNSLFTGKVASARYIPLGYSAPYEGVTGPGGDARGLKGGIESFAISVGALAPPTGPPVPGADFVLPSGNVNNVASVSDWTIMD